MADVSVTPANVVPQTGYSSKWGTSGEAGITAGMPVYLDATTRKYFKSQANASGTAKLSGIALTTSGLNQPICVLTAGSVSYGGIFMQGECYSVSAAAAGGVAPINDINATGEYPIILGVADGSGGSGSILPYEPIIGTAART